MTVTVRDPKLDEVEEGLRAVKRVLSSGLDGLEDKITSGAERITRLEEAVAKLNTSVEALQARPVAPPSWLTFASLILALGALGALAALHFGG